MGKEASRRDTPQRKLIRTILRSCCDHPTAETVYARARAVKPSIGFGTVYRNLSVLAEDGEILHLPIPGGADRYDGTVADHGHFFCRICGAFGDVATEKMADRLAPKGFAVDGLLLIIDGRCADCVNQEKNI